MTVDLENVAVTDSRNPLVFAYYVTGHGFGHATRVVEVVRHLINAGHDVHVVTGAPRYVFTTAVQSPRLFIRKVLLDCGAVQADALTVDRLASLEKYKETAVIPRESILATEAKWLRSIKADLVISDVVPVACRAAADAGIRSVCVTNFSWDFIYAEYVMAAGIQHRSIVWQIAEDYSHCEFLIRLPGYCPMPAFRDVIDVPLVVRRVHKSRKEVREELGVGEDVKLVIFNFGGQPAGWKLKEHYLPSGWLCLVCGASKDQDLPPNFIKLAKDVYTPDIMIACDCMLENAPNYLDGASAAHVANLLSTDVSFQFPVVTCCCFLGIRFSLHAYQVQCQFITDVTKFISGCMAALSAIVHLELAHVNILSKMDLVTRKTDLDDYLDPEPQLLISELNKHMAPQNQKLNKTLIE